MAGVIKFQSSISIIISMVAHWGHYCFSLIEISPVQISHFSFLQCKVLPYRARWSNAHAHFIQPVLKHLIIIPMVQLLFNLVCQNDCDTILPSITKLLALFKWEIALTCSDS